MEIGHSMNNNLDNLFHRRIGTSILFTVALESRIFNRITLHGRTVTCFLQLLSKIKYKNISTIPCGKNWCVIKMQDEKL